MLVSLTIALTLGGASAEPSLRPARAIEAMPTTAEEASERQRDFALRIEDAERAAETDPSAADATENRGAPMAASDRRGESRDRREGDKVNWLAPFSYYFPLTLDNDLEPETRNSMILIWILSALVPFGAYWSPFVFDEPGDGFLADMIVSAGAHAMVLSLPIYLFVIPIIGWVVGYLLLIGLAVANSYYLMPVASINLYDRSLKRKKAEMSHPLDLEQNPLPPSEDKKSRRKRGSDKVEDDEEIGGEAKARMRSPTVVYAY